MSDRVHIVEVGPRDGLQNEKTPVSVTDRIAFVEALIGAGVSPEQAAWIRILGAAALLVPLVLIFRGRAGIRAACASWPQLVPLLGLVYFFGKIVVSLFFMIWLRSTHPRLRYDRLMALGWKVLLPIALANVLVTAAALLDRAALLLGVDALGPGGLARLRPLALCRPDMGLPDQRGQPRAGIFAIGLLGAVFAGGDDDLATNGHPAAGQRLEARIDVRRQAEPEQVAAQLAGGRDLVDVLPARPRGGEETFFKRLLGNFKGHRRTRH